LVLVRIQMTQMTYSHLSRAGKKTLHVHDFQYHEIFE
jgi:hypothetical protein